jgi:hypothetical protein
MGGGRENVKRGNGSSLREGEWKEGHRPDAQPRLGRGPSSRRAGPARRLPPAFRTGPGGRVVVGSHGGGHAPTHHHPPTPSPIPDRRHHAHHPSPRTLTAYIIPISDLSITSARLHHPHHRPPTIIPIPDPRPRPAFVIPHPPARPNRDPPARQVHRQPRLSRLVEVCSSSRGWPAQNSPPWEMRLAWTAPPVAVGGYPPPPIRQLQGSHCRPGGASGGGQQ